MKSKLKAMTKYFCDACNKEDNRLYELPIYRHIINEIPIMGHVRVIDGKMHPVSGMQDSKHLCLLCYNKVMYPLWDSIKGIMKANDNRTESA